MERPWWGAFSKDYAERVKQGCVEWLAQCSVLLEEDPTLALKVIEESKARLERKLEADKRTIKTLKEAPETGKQAKDRKRLRQSLQEGVSHIGYTIAELDRLKKKHVGPPWRAGALCRARALMSPAPETWTSV